MIKAFCAVCHCLH